MSESIIALDVGSTACKGLRIRADGEVEAHASLVYPEDERPHDPHRWWHALREVVRRLHSQAPAPPAGICLCGRGTDLAFLAADGQPVEVPWSQVLRCAAVQPGAVGTGGRAARWGAVYRSVRDLAPRTADRIVRVCGVKDYLNFRLTGEWATDTSSAGCHAWPRDVAAYGLRPDMLPPIRQPHDVLGAVSAPADLPLPAGLPVLVGSLDGVSANVGAGMLAVGDGCVTLGTHGVLRVNTPGPLCAAPSFGAFTYPFLGETWTSGGDVLGGGAAAVWVAHLLGLLGGEAQTPGVGLAHLDALASAAPPGAKGLVCVPYLWGTVSPRPAPGQRGTFLDVAAAHGPGEFARAVLEGVAFALRHIRDAFVERGGVIRRLGLTGGGARSRVWPAIVASVLGVPLERTDPEASARGAAVFGALGLRLHPSVESASAAIMRSTGAVAPDPAWATTYDAAYRRYREAADA